MNKREFSKYVACLGLEDCTNGKSLESFKEEIVNKSGVLDHLGFMSEKTIIDFKSGYENRCACGHYSFTDESKSKCPDCKRQKYLYRSFVTVAKSEGDNIKVITDFEVKFHSVFNEENNKVEVKIGYISSGHVIGMYRDKYVHSGRVISKGSTAPEINRGISRFNERLENKSGHSLFFDVDEIKDTLNDIKILHAHLKDKNSNRKPRTRKKKDDKSENLFSEKSKGVLNAIKENIDFTPYFHPSFLIKDKDNVRLFHSKNNYEDVDARSIEGVPYPIPDYYNSIEFNGLAYKNIGISTLAFFDILLNVNDKFVFTSTTVKRKASEDFSKIEVANIQLDAVIEVDMSANAFYGCGNGVTSRGEKLHVNNFHIGQSNSHALIADNIRGLWLKKGYSPYIYDHVMSITKKGSNLYQILKALWTYNAYPVLEHFDKIGLTAIPEQYIMGGGSYDYYLIDKGFKQNILSSKNIYDFLGYKDKELIKYLSTLEDDFLSVLMLDAARHYKGKFTVSSIKEVGRHNLLEKIITTRSSKKTVILDHFSTFEELKDYITRVYDHQCIEAVEAISLLSDYLSMATDLGYDLTSPKAYAPSSLKKAHDIAMFAHRAIAQTVKEKKFQEVISHYEQFEYKDKETELLVTSPKAPGDIVSEGQKLSHCVGSYVQKVVDGDAGIMFIRKASDPDSSYYTVELADKDVVQVKGYGNKAPNKLVEAFLANWSKKKGLTCRI